MNNGSGGRTVPDASAFFDGVANEYAAWYQAPTPGGHALRERLRRVLDLLDKPGGKVLDVGCGPGILAEDLARLGYDVWGCDAAPGMIDQCRRRLYGADPSRFTVADAHNLSASNEFFDAVISTGVIDRLPDRSRAIGEMVRVLRPGGTLLVSFPNVTSPYASWKKLVFYPAVEAFHSVAGWISARSQPAALPASPAKLYTPRSAEALLQRHGVLVRDIVYYYFNPLLAPLDELFPTSGLRLVERLESLRSGRLRWIGAGFLVEGIKRTTHDHTARA